MNDFEEFERGVRLVIDNVHFDHDIIVSVFEVNIRVVGWALIKKTFSYSSSSLEVKSYL